MRNTRRFGRNRLVWQRERGARHRNRSEIMVDRLKDWAITGKTQQQRI